MSLSFGSLSVVGLFGHGLKLWLSRLGTLLPIFLIFQIPFLAGSLVLPLVIHRAGAGAGGLFLSSQVMSLLNSVFVFLAMGASACVVTQAVVGRRATLAQAFRVGLARWFKLMSAAVILSVLVHLPALLGILPGALFFEPNTFTGDLVTVAGLAVGSLIGVQLLFVWFMLTPQVVALEGAGPLAALGRAKGLMSGQFIRGVVVLLIMGIVMVPMGVAVTFVGSILPFTDSYVPGGGLLPVTVLTSYVNYVPTALVSYLFSAICNSLVSVIWTLFYYDVRAGQELGFNVAAIAQQQV